MAYSTKWTSSFQSSEKVNYTINILVDGYNGNAKRIEAAENPFTIDEDNSDEYFKPIRTQTGYIRIINRDTDLDGNTFNYSELIATNAMSHQVQLLSGSTVLWVGFIKPVVLTSTLFGYNNVVEIPVQCPLSVLGAINLKFDSNLTFPTIGQIFYSFFNRLDIRWNNLYLTANIRHYDQNSNAQPFPDMNARISMFNFSDNEDPTMLSGSTFSNYSAEWEDDTPASDILEDICKFWGWSLFVRGLDIYLIASGTVHSFYEIGFSELANVLGTGTLQSAVNPIDITDLEYMSTDHTEEYLQGFRKIKIEADANSDALVFDPKLQDLDYETPAYVATYTKDGRRVKSVQAWLTNPNQNKRIFLHNCRIFINHPDYPDLDAINVVGWYDNWEVGPSDDVGDLQNMSVKNSFDMKQDTVIYLRSGSEPATPTTRAELEAQTYIGLTSLQEVSIPAVSQLCLYARVSIGLNPLSGYETNTSDYVRMYLRIGDYWWNGFDWSTTMSVFKVYFNKHGEFMTTRAIYNQSTLNALYPDAKGYIIFNQSVTRRGVLEVGILNYPRYRTGIGERPNFCIIDFNVRCVVQDTTIRPQNKDKQTYEDIASQMFHQDNTIELKMASGTKNLYGKGQLYNSTTNGDRLSNCSYQGVSGRKAPEQYLLDNMKRVYGQTRHRMTIEVMENQSNTNPLQQFTYNNKNYILQSVKHDFWNDKMKLTLIEE